MTESRNMTSRGRKASGQAWLAVCLFAVLSLAACGSAPDSAPPAYAPETAPFKAGQTYVIWEVTSPSAEIPVSVWCSADQKDVSMLRGVCFQPGVFGADLSAFRIEPGRNHMRIRLGGRFAGLVSVTAGGVLFPFSMIDSRGIARPNGPTAPGFRISDGRVAYLGHYDADAQPFETGRWRPDALKAALDAAGRGDIADRMDAEFPTRIDLDCKGKQASRKRCRIIPTNKLFPGLVRE